MPPRTKTTTTTTRTTRSKAKQESPAIPRERESIVAYLRIRPQDSADDEPAQKPYLEQLSDTSVRMTEPPGKSSVYQFSHVFPPDTTQSDFFTNTTLPLVHDVLNGQNALLFAYGVTNSGKTYTMQGGSQAGSAGILPRTLDVIFNSIQSRHGDGKFEPVRLHGIELARSRDSSCPPHLQPALAEVLGSDADSSSDPDVDPTTLNLDKNYDYTVWLSCAEVYNEKVYDLLEDTKSPPSRSGIDKSLVLTRKALTLKSSPPSDGQDKAKYISGLRQFRVTNAAQGKSLVRLGQLHRRVFGTLANRESSRSHSMVILKLVRCHRGEKNDPGALQISRLTLVDLAGSERTKHTHTTGDRLKEAGNINKSLMVLGQCLEVMRANQRKLAASLGEEDADGRMDTRTIKKGLAVVPFRHSKLTECLMDYFVGDGRTAMIVNVNPYDTGYDENSHVMKFAALARDVLVAPAPAPLQRVPGQLSGKTIKGLGPLTLTDPDIIPNRHTRKVTISLGGSRATDTVLEVVEVDEDADIEDDDTPINPLVDALFDEVEELRMQLFEAEMRCALIEAETREEVMSEMEGRMRKMQEMHARRLRQEIEQNEMKMDAKIDLLYRSGLFANGSPTKKNYS